MTGDRARRAAGATLLAALLSVSGARAQTLPEPTAFVPEEGMAYFRECRAAAFFHLDAPEDAGSRVPHRFALMLRDQIDFIMAESIFAKPHGDLDDAQALLGFTESWFIGFSRAIGETRERFEDRRAREDMLIGCAPVIWSIARLYIDAMAGWRARTDPTPPDALPRGGGGEARAHGAAARPARVSASRSVRTADGAGRGPRPISGGRSTLLGIRASCRQTLLDHSSLQRRNAPSLDG
jgi:hypothetical protein